MGDKERRRSRLGPSLASIRASARHGAGGGALLLLLAFASPLMLGAGPFEGSFLGEEGERITLTQKAKKVEGEVEVRGTRMKIIGQVHGQALAGKVMMPWGDSAAYSARLKNRGGVLVFQLEGESQDYARVSAQAASPPSPAAARQVLAPALAGPAHTSQGSRRLAPPATPRSRRDAGAMATSPKAEVGGKLFRSETHGWSIQLPKGWEGRETESQLLLGSKTEAGMIVVVDTSLREQGALEAELGNMVDELGSFAPAKLQAFHQPTGTFYSAETSGRSVQGETLSVIVFARSGARGSVALLGATTAEHFASLSERVRTMGASIKFFAPKESPARAAIVGEWWSFSSGTTLYGGASTEKSLAFCADGSYRSDQESSISGGAGQRGAYGQVGQNQRHGRWRVEGGPKGGTVYVTHGKGGEEAIPFQLRGDGVHFAGRLYARTGKKRCP